MLTRDHVPTWLRPSVGSFWKPTCLLFRQQEEQYARRRRSSPADQVAGHERVAREMEEVLSRRLPYFYGIAYRFLGNAADAEDAVQEGLLTAYKNLHQFRGEAQLSTWLATIVSNSARMQLRLATTLYVRLAE